MSSIPTPVTRSAGSRLPGPKTAPTPAGSRSKGPEFAVPTATGKRPRGSEDLEDGLAKRTKNDLAAPTGTLNKAKSMMNIANTTRSSRVTNTSAARVAKPLSHKMMTGRPTSVTAKTASMTGPQRRQATTAGGARGAMSDRTNVAVKSETTGNANKKRAPWDLKGRLTDMEAEFSSTNTRLALLESQNKSLKSDVQHKENEVAQNNQQLDDLKAENASLREKCEGLAKQLEKTKTDQEESESKFRRQLSELEADKASLERRLKALENDLVTKEEELFQTKLSLSKITASSAGISAELEGTKKLLEASQAEVAKLTSLNSDQAAAIASYEDKERAFEMERRRLHNAIQELKGNIRVFCRVRPLLVGEENNSDGNIKHIEIINDNSLALVRKVDNPCDAVAGGLKGKNGRYDFDFDRVFGPGAKQEEVFNEISQLVQSAIDGYNVCIFAYGQTGSGKTFTMEGGTDEDQKGMIPLTISKIFEETARLTEKGWSYKLEASFLEIYNEDIKDLLATEKNLKYDIKRASSGGCDIHVTNLRVEEVSTECQVASLLRLARKNRAVAATACNEHSSRSHSVFQLRISGSNDLTTENCTGTLNLVDLAGSERLKESGSEGARLTETKNINKSLANLGNVIMALAQKDSHVPFRNSKLTHLLQNSLGGNSKTLMFVNLSPREDFLMETLNSLRFAKKVNQCHIGTATKKVK